MEERVITARDGLGLSTIIAEAKETKGLVQMIHGAKEHKGRYIDFIKYLNDHGFTVIMADNRGHGKSVNETYPLGYMDGHEQIIDDQMVLTNYIKQLYPGKKLHLFGHSLGSVFARCYVAKHDEELEKVVLSGTVNYVPGIDFGIWLGKMISTVSGKHGYNSLLEQLSFKNQTGDAWLSENQANIENYRKDPYCQYDYQNHALVTMLRAVKQLHATKSYKCKNPQLPFLSISGVGDPMTGDEKGLQDSLVALRKAGYDNLRNIIYPNMKHEVLHEDDKHIVYRDVVAFLSE